MKRIAYELYNPSHTIVENAQMLGCSIVALKKYLKSKGIDKNFDAQYVRWFKIQDFYRKKPSATLKDAQNYLGYSINTIRRYKLLSIEELFMSKRDIDKVSSFDICNKNSIKSISYNQDEILAWIMQLYNGRQPFDCDLTASKCVFWNTLPLPKNLFDIYPQIEGVKHLSETDHLDNECFSSIIFDLPFIVSTGSTCRIKTRFSYFKSEDELYKANDNMLKLSFRLLKNKGLLVVKTMDISNNGKQLWVSDYVLSQAQIMGFELIDKFILLSNLRLFYKTHRQHIARKYHSYFFVFKKIKHDKR